MSTVTQSVILCKWNLQKSFWCNSRHSTIGQQLPNRSWTTLRRRRHYWSAEKSMRSSLVVGPLSESSKERSCRSICRSGTTGLQKSRWGRLWLWDLCQGRPRSAAVVQFPAGVRRWPGAAVAVPPSCWTARTFRSLGSLNPHQTVVHALKSSNVLEKCSKQRKQSCESDLMFKRKSSNCKSKSRGHCTHCHDKCHPVWKGFESWMSWEDWGISGRKQITQSYILIYSRF